MFERLIVDAAARYPRDPAMRLGLDLAPSFTTMANDVRRAAGWLKKAAIAPGARVVIHLKDAYLHWVLSFACEARGIVFIPEAPSATLDADRLAFLGACHVLSWTASPGIEGIGWSTIDRMWHLRLRTLRVVALPDRARAPDDPVCILLSSGTTGSAKKVLLTREAIDGRLGHVLAAYTGERGRGLLCLVPVQSFTGFMSVLTGWGQARAIGVRLAGGSYAALLATGWFDAIVAAPIHLADVLTDLPEDAAPAAGLRLTTGGSPLGDALAAEVRRRLSPDLRMGYGTTEAGVVTRAPLISADHHVGYAGIVLPWVEVEIVDGAGTPQPTGTSGEVRIRAAYMVDSYLDDPEATRRCFRDGWYHPGDVGRLDAERGLTIEGRVDELINVGGRKVLPALVEARVLALSGVAEAAAFAIHDAGDGPRLGIAVRGDASIDPTAVAGAIPEFPGAVVVRVEALPRNAMGKVERRVLADRWRRP